MRRRRLAGLVLTGLLAAGCGGLPLPGGVRVERTIAAGGDDTGSGTVRVLPPPPAVGASPLEVVRGFLNAQADSEDDYGIARQYLGPGTPWSTSKQVTVYAAASYPGPAAVTPPPATSTAPARGRPGGPTSPAAGRPTGTSVQVTLARSATIDAAGVYTPQADRVTDIIRLEQVGGEWRITGPPAGLQLSAGDVERNLLPSTLWWFAPDRSTLVPEVRWLPAVAAGRQTQLVRALLGGPSPQLAAAVRTAAPAGVTLDGSVSVAGSDIVVDLSQGAAALSASSARQLLIQLAATLRPSSTGDAVRIEVAGQPLPSSLAPQRLPLDVVAEHDVDNQDPQAAPVALVDGRVTAVTGGTPLSGPAAATLRGRDLTVAVPAAVGGGFTAVEGTGATQRVVAVDPGGRLRQVGPPGRYGTPSTAADGTLVVPGPGGLLVALPGRAPLTVPVSAGPVASVRIARDGVLLVVVVGGRAYRSTLVRGAGPPELGPLAAVSTGPGEVHAAAWETTSTLALLVRAADGAGGAATLVQLQMDGALARQLPLPAEVGRGEVTLASAVGVPPLVGGGGRIAELAGDTWQLIGRGAAPAAPG